jgi:hypothetical protein
MKQPPSSRAKPDEQRELFHAKPDRPRWSDFSGDVQRTVTELVARMLRQHGQAAASRAEVEHE